MAIRPWRERCSLYTKGNILLVRTQFFCPFFMPSYSTWLINIDTVKHRPDPPPHSVRTKSKMQCPQSFLSYFAEAQDQVRSKEPPGPTKFHQAPGLTVLSAIAVCRQYRGMAGMASTIMRWSRCHRYCIVHLSFWMTISIFS